MDSDTRNALVILEKKLETIEEKIDTIAEEVNVFKEDIQSSLDEDLSEIKSLLIQIV